jgi:hypothetical protein
VNATGFYPRVRVDAAPVSAAGSAGGVLLTQTVRAAGLDVALSQALGRWRSPLAVHDPAKVLTDLAVALVLGGDCLADAALLRGEPELFGSVASEATVSRTVAALGVDVDKVLAQVARARKQARAAVWAAAGEHAPTHQISGAAPLVIDLDATLITAHSEKDQAAPTFKRGFGFHPLCAFVDHGAEGTGELLAMTLRAGNAGSNTAADHIEVTRAALGAVPGINPSRPGRKVLIRTDGGGGTKDYVTWLAGRGVSYSIGWTLPWAHMQGIYAQIPPAAWTAALNGDGAARDGADVADITDLLAAGGHLGGWPPRMRVIVRRERPHPGAGVSQGRLDDAGGYRLTAFVTNTTTGQLQDLELRHRRRARCEDRIRAAKDTGLRNLPLKNFGANRIWCAIVALASDLTAWTQMLAFATTAARRWEPKRLRTRLLHVPATLARHARTMILHVKDTHPWAEVLTAGHQRLTALPAPT